MDVARSSPHGAHLTGQALNFAMLIRICIKGLICVLLCTHAVENPLHSVFRPITSFASVYVMKEQRRTHHQRTQVQTMLFFSSLEEFGFG